jgi:hypothetical protein
MLRGRSTTREMRDEAVAFITGTAKDPDTWCPAAVLDGRDDLAATAHDAGTLTDVADRDGEYVPRVCGQPGESSASVHSRLVGSLGDRLAPAVTFATTEHFNLQTARAITVSECNGRASIYLAALASNLIALAFVGQMSRLGTEFYAFALILLPVLAFVGVVTFQRLVQSAIEDIAYAQRIGRLRDFYLTLAPELEPYLLVALEPRAEAHPDCEPFSPSTWQLTRTTAGMVAVVNSVVIGACAGLVLQTLHVGSLAVALAAGAITGAATLKIQCGHQQRARDAYRPQDVDRAAILVPTRPVSRSAPPARS